MTPRNSQVSPFTLNNKEGQGSPNQNKVSAGWGGRFLGPAHPFFICPVASNSTNSKNSLYGKGSVMLTSFRNLVKPEKFAFARELRRRATPAERHLWAHIRRRQLGPKFQRQKVMLGYIVDFWCPRYALVLEVDGSSHIGREEYDARRTAALEAIGARVLRFSNNSVFNETDLVLALIQKEFHV